MMEPNPLLDPTDLRILRALQRDGRISIVALAEAVHLSPTPCQRRVRRLEESGVIRQYTAVLDANRLGFRVQAFVQVTLEGHAEELTRAFQQAIATRAEVTACWVTSGEMDYLLHVVAADLEAFADFALKALLRMPGVKTTRSSFVLGTLKPPGGLAL
jgi:Lrp/AsnC family leucine-responsive transcriptional regulator